MAPEKRPDAQQRVPRPADRMTEWQVKSWSITWWSDSSLFLLSPNQVSITSDANNQIDALLELVLSGENIREYLCPSDYLDFLIFLVNTASVSQWKPSPPAWIHQAWPGVHVLTCSAKSCKPWVSPQRHLLLGISLDSWGTYHTWISYPPPPDPLLKVMLLEIPTKRLKMFEDFVNFVPLYSMLSPVISWWFRFELVTWRQPKATSKSPFCFASLEERILAQSFLALLPRVQVQELRRILRSSVNLQDTMYVTSIARTIIKYFVTRNTGPLSWFLPRQRDYHPTEQNGTRGCSLKFKTLAR